LFAGPGRVRLFLTYVLRTGLSYEVHFHSAFQADRQRGVGLDSTLLSESCRLKGRRTFVSRVVLLFLYIFVSESCRTRHGSMPLYLLNFVFNGA